MKKKLLILFTIIMVMALSIAIVACSDYNDKKEPGEEVEKIVRTMLVPNGTFYDASASAETEYVKSKVTGWTATKGSIGTTATGVTVGVIDIGKEADFNANSDTHSTISSVLQYPGVDPKTPYETDDFGNSTNERQDTNALLIASVETQGSLYYKTSSSITLEANKYYLLQYSICTNIESTVDNKAKKGAWVQVSGGVTYTDSCINTDGKWETHYLYIESNKYTTKNIDIILWLGNGPDTINSITNDYTVKGSALFDNIICKEVVKDKDGVTDFNHTTFTNKANTNTNKIYGYESCYFLSDMKMEQLVEASPTSTNAKNFYYSFREGIYSSANSSNYNLIKGKKDITSSDQPTVNTPHTGIVNLSKLYTKEEDKEAVDTYKALLQKDANTYYSSWSTVSYENWKNKVIGDNGGRKMSDLDETKALMIYHSDLSGAGFVSNSTIYIKSNNYYVISVWAYVNALTSLPTTKKPASPLAYTELQKAFIDARSNTYFTELDYEMTMDYFNESGLTDEENNKITGDNAIYDPENVPTSVEQFKGNESSLFRYKGSGPFQGYQAQVYEQFKYYFLWLDKKDEETDENIKSYLEYQMLIEKKAFLSGSYKTLVDLEKKWAKYEDDLAEYMSKYNSWLSATSGTEANQKPYAHVKLTGAGDDIVEQTTELGQWQKLTFYIQGNQLSSRNLTMEFWFGEGASTDYTTLMMGTAFFDNIEIYEYTAENAPAHAWQTLNPITNSSELVYGGLTNDMDIDTFRNNFWKLEMENNDVASGDISQVSYNRNEITEMENVDFSSITAATGITSYYELLLKNSIATASVLTSREYITINPNTAYRIAMLVKTSEFATDLGAEIHLLGGDDKDKLTSGVSNVSKINKDKWQEVVFYVLGDVIKTNYVTLKIKLGSGNRFSTGSYLLGEIHIALINVAKIKYSEFNAGTKSGDIVKSYTFSNTTAATDSVTNGSFSAIDLSATEKEAFDENGKITDTAITSNWSKGTIKNNIFTKPTVSMANDIITWDKVYGVKEDGTEAEPIYYEIWARYKDSGNKYQEKYINYVLASGELAFNAQKLFKNVNVNYKIRAVGKSGGSIYDMVSAFSNYSGEITSDAINGAYNTVEDYIEMNPTVAYPEIKCTGGTVLLNKETDFAPETGNYVSPYKTALKISSNYAVSYTLTSSTTNLNANSYYKVSVWVKTVDAKASVTLKDVNAVLSAKSVTGKHIGFVNVDTQGKWQLYSFYVEMGNTSGSLSLELSLGNAYVNKVSKKSTNVTSDATVYSNNGLSSGTVYFDNVKVLTINKDEYEIASEKTEIENGADLYYNFNIADISKEFSDINYVQYSNQYALRILECLVDSFDSFTQNSVEEGKDGHNLGHTPNNYSWSKSDQAKGTSEKERVYGVYSINDDISKLEMIYKKTDGDDLVNAFSAISAMPANFDIAKFIGIDGSNSLVMSNKELFGQTYKVSNISSIKEKGYYKITFKAKTLLASQEIDSDGNIITDENNKPKYTMENTNAEFRYMPTTDSTKYQSIYINSNGRTEDIYQAVEYTMYIYNPSSTSASSNWSFVLGADKVSDDKTGAQKQILGIMVIDQVSISQIDEEAYVAAKTGSNYDNLDENAKTMSINKFYEYSKDEEPEEPEPDDDDTEEPEKDKDKKKIWDRGEIWLLVSSIIIGAMILAVIIVMLIRRWRKKHPKEIVGENILKAEKEIKVITPEQQFKEDIADNSEYIDEKPRYVQRVVKNNKKKKKK